MSARPTWTRWQRTARCSENGFTPTAICSPARASMMTGLYAHKHHMFNNSTPRYSYCQHLRPDMRMVQDWAADETDYETAYYGKWHIGPPPDLFASRFEHAHRPPYPGRTPLFANGPRPPEHGAGAACPELRLRNCRHAGRADGRVPRRAGRQVLDRLHAVPLGRAPLPPLRIIARAARAVDGARGVGNTL